MGGSKTQGPYLETPFWSKIQSFGAYIGAPSLLWKSPNGYSALVVRSSGFDCGSHGFEPLPMLHRSWSQGTPLNPGLTGCRKVSGFTGLVFRLKGSLKGLLEI